MNPALIQKIFFLSLLALILNLGAISQDLFKPRDISRAFKNGTRSLDGKPGKNYWQNGANYQIFLELNPQTRIGKGSESIVYFNQSPDTLKSLTTRLYLNIHRPGAARDGGASEDYLSKGMQIDSMAINGKSQAWNNDPRYFTVEPFRLNHPLLPHDSIRIFFKWHFELSKESGREGMIDSSTAFLAYFYPRIAVYDDYEGWDRAPFVDSKEFYSDFNNYDVKIKVPENFMVWGTGTLHHPESLFTSKILKKYYQSFSTDSILKIVDLETLKNHTALIPGSHIWEFTAQHIPDMTFAASNHFVWDASSVLVDKSLNRRASVQSAYNDTSQDYHHMVEFARHSLDWFSNHLPGVPYPYEKTTIFQGFADMEYPMMVNDTPTPSLEFSRFVVEHEIAHTYMPFYMGINETRYGFMDEGWATTFEYLIGNEDLGEKKEADNYKDFRVGYMSDYSAEEQIPIITPGTALTGRGLGSNEYGKASLGYLAVKSLLGEESFKKCLQTYMSRWNGKHPIPWDFFYTFNNISQKNLNWFWKAVYFDPSYVDMAIESVKKINEGYRIEIKNIGGMPAPMKLIVKYTGGKEEIIDLNPMIWEKDLHAYSYVLKTQLNLESLNLDGGIFLDAEPKDNSWKKP